jgi:hypothetical protein
VARNSDDSVEKNVALENLFTVFDDVGDGHSTVKTTLERPGDADGIVSQGDARTNPVGHGPKAENRKTNCA